MVLKKRMVTSHLMEVDLENIVTKFLSTFHAMRQDSTKSTFKKSVVEDKICYVGFSPIG